MSRLVAFLRGINLGDRRVTNDELRSHFEDPGLEGVSPVPAEVNVYVTFLRETALNVIGLVPPGVARWGGAGSAGR